MNLKVQASQLLTSGKVTDSGQCPANGRPASEASLDTNLPRTQFRHESGDAESLVCMGHALQRKRCQINSASQDGTRVSSSPRGRLGVACGPVNQPRRRRRDHSEPRSKQAPST